MDNRKILVADDAIFMRTMIVSILEELNCVEIIQAEDGEQAVSLYKEHKPALVMLDVSMPVMDGIETLEAILEFDDEANVVMCTANEQDLMITKALEIGAKEFVTKPFRKKVLEAIVLGFLEEGE